MRLGSRPVARADRGAARRTRRYGIPPTALGPDTGPVSQLEVDEYLAALDQPKRSTLAQLREAILEVVPDAEEGLAYGTPAFKVRGKAVAGSLRSSTT